MANRELFGKASTGGGGSKTRHHRLVDGSNIYRIAPAYGTLAASGKWFRFIKQHWGYKSTGNDQNPQGFPRLFICPEDVDFRTKIVRRACAECTAISTTAANVENKTQKLKEAGKTDEEINTVLGVQKQWLKEHNLDKKYMVIAKNMKEEWGILWLPFKAKEALDNRRKKVLEEEGYDILDADEGAWIEFTRSGTFRTTVYGCDVVSELVATASGKKARQTKQEALTDADFDMIVAEVPDLSTIGTSLTDEQIERLVESGGDPEVVEAIFNEGREASASPVKKAEPKMAPRPVTKPVTTNTAPAPVTNTPGVATATTVTVPVVDDEEAELLAQVEALRAKKAAKALADAAAKAPPPVEASPVPTADAENLPDDQFLAMYKPK